MSTLVVAPPGSEGGSGAGLGCGPLAKLWDDESEVVFYQYGDNEPPSDSCPQKEFCERWGCPDNFNWASAGTAPYQVTVESDNSDRIIHVTATSLSGGSWEQDCKYDPIDEGDSGDIGGASHWAYLCEFSWVSVLQWPDCANQRVLQSQLPSCSFM